MGVCHSMLLHCPLCHPCALIHRADMCKSRDHMNLYIPATGAGNMDGVRTQGHIRSSLHLADHMIHAGGPTLACAEARGGC